MRLRLKPLLALAGAILFASPGSAQSIDFMLNECSSTGQSYFRDFTARTDMKYNGQRVDGTHAINGRIFLETRYEDFACSYNSNGRRMVEFFAEGRLQNAFIPGSGGSGSSGGASEIARVTGIPAGDVLNVRSGPGTSYRIVGALGNGDRVRNLGCQSQGSSRWCRIEMMTDMRERGWVNGRYLIGGTESQRPSRPPQAHGTTATERVRFAAGSSRAVLNGGLTPGSSVRYVLGARNGQFLAVNIEPYGPGISYQILNPDGSFLLDQISSSRPYGGELWQTGDHVIEIINRGNRNTSYQVMFSIE